MGRCARTLSVATVIAAATAACAPDPLPEYTPLEGALLENLAGFSGLPAEPREGASRSSST